jgi:hypothetical protein
MFVIQNKLSKFYIKQYDAKFKNCDVTKDINAAQQFDTEAAAKAFVKKHSSHGIPTTSAIFVELKAAPKAATAAATKSETITSVATKLLLAGKTNAEVWAVIQPQFQLDDGKKGYPSWYRNQLKKKGLL